MGTTTDKSATIRAALKAHGYTSRHVSVKSDYYAGGSSIRIRIKDASVPRALVAAIATPFEDVRRCEITGDILAGGNTYVDICYTSEARHALADAYQSRVEAAFAQAHDNLLIPVERTPFLVGRGRFADDVAVWGDSRHLMDACDARTAAAFIGQRMVELVAEAPTTGVQ